MQKFNIIIYVLILSVFFIGCTTTNLTPETVEQNGLLSSKASFNSLLFEDETGPGGDFAVIPKENQHFGQTMPYTFTFEVIYNAYEPVEQEIASAEYNMLFHSEDLDNDSSYKCWVKNNTLYFSWHTLETGVELISKKMKPGCHHISVVRDYTKVSFYIDGSLLYTESVDSSEFIIKSRLIIGGENHYSYPDQDGIKGYYNGEIDELRIWNKALDAATINDFLFTEIEPEMSGLQAYYMFKNDNNIIKDFTGHGNDGYLGISPFDEEFDPIRIGYTCVE